MGEEFVTNDLQLASYLAAIGHPPVRVEGGPERKFFVFRHIPAVDVAAYHRGTVRVPPLALFTQYRRLKRQLFTQPA